MREVDLDEARRGIVPPAGCSRSWRSLLGQDHVVAPDRAWLAAQYAQITASGRQSCCFGERGRLRADRRVTVSMIASPSAISPAAWAGRTWVPSETGEASETGFTFCRAGCAAVPGAGFGEPAGVIAGKSPAALPAPMSELAAPLRFGTGPSGSAGSRAEPASTAATDTDDADFDDADFDVAGFDDEADDAAGAAVTAVVSDAAGGVHFAVVVTLAVAVSVTELTEVAFEATGICA
jgi:hypothetical protein